MAKALKNCAFKQTYHSQNQFTIAGFESPFSKSLDPYNRWVVLAQKIPWDILAKTYLGQMGNNKTGADGINLRAEIGAMIFKHLCDLSDRETVLHIQENMYMQYFLRYSSFATEEPFDPSLFVDFRKWLGIEQINKNIEQILGLGKAVSKDVNQGEGNQDSDNLDVSQHVDPQKSTTSSFEENVKIESSHQESTIPGPISHKGTLICDAKACLQDIAYPTDLNLLNDARVKSEKLIDVLFNPLKHQDNQQVLNKF
ncbi:MAG: transposase [Bacteroidales bacterium]